VELYLYSQRTFVACAGADLLSRTPRREILLANVGQHEGRIRFVQTDAGI